MESTVLIAIIAVLGLGFLALIFRFSRKRGGDSLMLLQKQMDGMREQVRLSLQDSSHAMTQQLSQMIGHVNERLRDNSKVLESTNQNMGQRLDNAAKVVGDVHRKLGELESASARIFEVGKDISSLQDILKAPKLRGVLGEIFLGNLLEQVFPAKKYFTLEYAFKSGEKVDAAIRVGDRLLPVDSKFPLENFRKFLSAGNEDKKTVRRQFINDVKKHIDAIADKYILPDEGTFEFALMYIPAENVYYEVIIKDEQDFDLFQYAYGKKVIPVSPNSFFAYLQLIIQGLRGMVIEKNVKEVLHSLTRLRGDFQKFSRDFEKMGKHLNNSRSCFDDAEKKLTQIGDKLSQIDRLEQEELPKQVAVKE